MRWVRDGLTLIEVLVTLTIIGIAASAAMPAYHRVMHEDPAERAARQLANALSRARVRALERGSSVRFRLDIRDGAYQATSETDTTEAELFRGSLAGDAVMHSPVEEPLFVFSSLGSARADLVELRSTARTLVVRVKPLSGEAVVQRTR